MSRTVVVAMSGGVDSSVAAALLHEQGDRVIGVGLRFPELMPAGESLTCCGMTGMVDARAVAAQIGIPFYVLDYRDAFTEAVIAPFCRAYAVGETPNPCILCNAALKFGALLDQALALDADYIATGHYARIERAAEGGLSLLQGIDRERDQTYFLYALTPQQMAHTLFPVGGLTKPEVRAIAARFGLPVAAKPGSQDICFVGQADYREFLAQHEPEALRPGPIIDALGRVLGEHQGIAAYTLGQRRGLGIAAREPLFVIGIDPAQNVVIVGPAQETYTTQLVVRNLNWISGSAPKGPLRVEARTRYRGAQLPATLMPEGEGVVITWDEPHALVAPGQAVVFYHGESVLGGGVAARSA